jgi:hypothetical protein
VRVIARRADQSLIVASGVTKAPEVKLALTLGRWTHIAAVFDAPSGTAITYIDGEVAAVSEIPVDVAPRPGNTAVGSWHRPQHPYAWPGEFRGRIDEVTIWDRALPQSEIQQLCRNGRPELDMSGGNMGGTVTQAAR